MIAALVGADQAVKYWAVNSLRPKGSIDFIHFGDFKVIDLTYLENDGAIFGSMSGQKWFLIGFTSIVLIGCAVLLVKEFKRSKLLDIALSLFIAGGIGNLIDRVQTGLVIDMICIPWFSTFNVADIFITFGAIILVLYILIKDKEFLEDKPKKDKEPRDEA